MKAGYRRGLAVLLVLIAAVHSAASAQLPPQFRATAPAAGPQPVTAQEGFTIVAGGDLLANYRPRADVDDPELAQVIALMRDADATFANLESNVFDIRSFEGYPAAENGGGEQGGVGGGPLFPAAVAADLRAMGITMVSFANNHTLDWNVEGMLDTMSNLDAAGVVYAGAGSNLATARAAAFQETRQGRVALVATASTFLPMAPAGPGRGDRAPRPGISALRNEPIVTVNAEELATLRGISARMHGPAAEGANEILIQPNSDLFGGQAFRLGDEGGVTYQVNEADHAEILEAIRAGKRLADVAVFSIHAHETASGGQEHEVPNSSLEPADFLQNLHRAAVDAGADMVITHGPHALRGIEIYKGRPIFYGMGSLFFAVGANWPQDWYESVLARVTFADGQASEIRLYPLIIRTAQNARQRSHIGAPRLANRAEAQRILATLQEKSARYGTRIAIEDSVGVIRVPQP